MERNQKVIFTEEGFADVAKALTDYPEEMREQVLSGFVAGSF